jgi:hypothetical protein
MVAILINFADRVNAFLRTLSSAICPHALARSSTALAKIVDVRVTFMVRGP